MFTLKLARQGKLLAITGSSETAQQNLGIQALAHHIPFLLALQRECITIRRLPHDIPTDVSCEEIAEDLKEVGINSWEVRRFTKTYKDKQPQKRQC